MVLGRLAAQLVTRAGIRVAAVNTSWLFADRLVRSAVDLGLSLLMAHQLGLTAFGAFAWALSVVMILQSLVGLGLDAVALKELVARPTMRSAIVGSVFFLRLATGVFVCGAVVATQIFYLHTVDWEPRLTILLAVMLIPQCATAFDVWFASRTRAKDVLLPRLVAFVMFLPIKLLALIVWRDLSFFAMTMVGEACLSALLAYFAYRAHSADLPKLRFSRPIALDLIRQSLPLLGLGFFTVLQARLDQIMLGQLLGEAALGRYALALRVVEMATGIPVVIMASISPALAHAHVRDPQLFRDRVLNSYRLMILLSLAVSVPIVPIAWLAEAFDHRLSELALSSLFIILIPRVVLAAMGLVKTLYLTNMRLLHWGLVTAMMGAVVNLVGNSVFIPTFGISGAILASSISFFLQIVLLDAIHPMTRGHFSLMLRGMSSFWKFRIT